MKFLKNNWLWFGVAIHQMYNKNVFKLWKRGENYDKKSNPISVNIDDLSSYKVAKMINKNTTGSNKFNKLMNGVTYTYRVVSYKMINGERVESVMSAPVSITMDYYSHNVHHNTWTFDICTINIYCSIFISYTYLMPITCCIIITIYICVSNINISSFIKNNRYKFRWFN